MQFRDDERAFRDAVAGGESPDAAVKRLNVPARMVKLFTRRLPKAKAEQKPVAWTQPRSSVLAETARRVSERLQVPAQATEPEGFDGNIQSER